MDDFRGGGDIVLQPADDGVPYAFAFTPCTGPTTNDGAIPYGTTVSSAVVTAKDAATGTDATAAMVKSSSVAQNVVTALLKYPSALGTFHLKFVLTLSTAAKIEADFRRVIARD